MKAQRGEEAHGAGVFLSGLIPSSAPHPRSTWGAVEYPIESVKSHSLKGMGGAVWAWVRHLYTGLLLGFGVLGQVQLLSVPVSQGLRCFGPQSFQPCLPILHWLSFPNRTKGQTKVIRGPGGSPHPPFLLDGLLPSLWV